MQGCGSASGCLLLPADNLSRMAEAEPYHEM
jgi:hypothetical protein